MACRCLWRRHKRRTRRRHRRREAERSGQTGSQPSYSRAAMKTVPVSGVTFSPLQVQCLSLKIKMKQLTFKPPMVMMTLQFIQTNMPALLHITGNHPSPSWHRKSRVRNQAACPLRPLPLHFQNTRTHFYSLKAERKYTKALKYQQYSSSCHKDTFQSFHFLDKGNI